MDTNRDIENFKSSPDGLTERIKLNTGEVFTNERSLEERVAACEIAIGNLEDDTLKKAQNLDDVQNKQTSLANLESSAATPASADDYGYDTTTQQSKSNVQVQTTWGGGIPMAVPFKDFADTVIDTSANPLPISKGGTNAQTEDSAIYNLLGSDTTAVLDTAVRDDGVLPYRCDSAYAQGSNFGKVSLLQIFNNWLKAKLQDWLGITVTESGGSITRRSFAGTATQNFEFTYIVDSDQKLTDWANNVEGNDYTSVLIKKSNNPYTLSVSSGINLTTTGTKVIVGEAGSKIIINKTSSGTGTGISYDTLPTTNDYFIFNLTLEYNSTSGRALLRCINLTNCQIVANGNSTSVNITGLESCVNILRCDAKAYQSDVGNYSAGYRNCSNIRESSGYGEALTRGTGFYGCNSVQFCKDTSTAQYYDSYSSPTADPTYACANTLNGGWNQ